MHRRRSSVASVNFSPLSAVLAGAEPERTELRESKRTPTKRTIAMAPFYKLDRPTLEERLPSSFGQLDSLLGKLNPET